MTKERAEISFMEVARRYLAGTKDGDISERLHLKWPNSTKNC
jgi:hypothetical protein